MPKDKGVAGSGYDLPSYGISSNPNTISTLNLAAAAGHAMVDDISSDPKTSNKQPLPRAAGHAILGNKTPSNKKKSKKEKLPENGYGQN